MKEHRFKNGYTPWSEPVTPRQNKIIRRTSQGQYFAARLSATITTAQPTNNRMLGGLAERQRHVKLYEGTRGRCNADNSAGYPAYWRASPTLRFEEFS